jgi:hypothetical protein
MAGSNKWFTYTSNDGTDWALKADESNVEGIMGSVGSGAPAGQLYKPPRNLRPRFAVFGNAAGTRQIKVPVLTETVYNALSAEDTIPDGVAGTGTLNFIRKRPELIFDSPTAFDTGLTDGDQP